VKDRAALNMIRTALADGRLTPGKRILDATSGNTGIAYAWIGAAFHVPVALVMPENVSDARKRIARAYGAQVILSDPLEQSDGAIRLARKLAQEDPSRWLYADQYSNEANPRAHQLGTAREIWEQTRGRVTHLVLGIGTGGTIMGTSRGLKARNPRIQAIAVEPADALHGLEGLKHLASSLVPPIYDPSVPDEIMPVTTEDGWDMADRLAREEGLHVGHSSGASVLAAVRIAEKLEKEGRSGCIVAIVCDRGDRYFAPLAWEKRYVW